MGGAEPLMSGCRLARCVALGRTRQRSGSSGRIVVLVVLVAVVVAAVVFGDVRSWSPARLQVWVDGFGALGPLVFVALFVVGAVLLVPGTVVAVVAALLFPLWLAVFLAWTATMGGAVTCFLLARFVGRGFVERRLGPHVARLDDAIAERGFRVVFLLRLIGMPPINMMNYAAGLTKVRFSEYVVATALGVLPFLAAVATIVSRIGRAPRPIEIATDSVLWGAVGVVLVVALVAHRLRPKMEPLVHEEDEAP